MPNPQGRNGSSAAAQLGRAQILEATERCLCQWGYDATTIRRIAGELDCAVGSIYRYFRDKRDLLYAVCQRSLEPVAALAESGAAPEQCERLYRAQVREAPQLYRLMFWLASVVQQQAAAPEQCLPEVVQRLIDCWTHALGDPASARLRWATLHAAIMAGSDGPEMNQPATPGAAAADRQAILASLTPLPPLPAMDHRVAEPPAGEPDADRGPLPEAQPEDVCLL